MFVFRQHHSLRTPPCRPTRLLRQLIAADNAAMEAEPPKADLPHRKRRCFQFRLRTLLIGAGALSLLAVARMSGMSDYEVVRIVRIVYLAVTIALVAATLAWIVRLLVRRRFSLLEMVLFVSWSAVVCCLIVSMWRD
jgi:hypothetical protein